MNRTLALIFAVSCTSTALAARLDRAWVDPEATWMVHVDFEGLMASQFVQGVVAQAGVELHELEQQMRAEIHEELAHDSDVPPEVLEAWNNVDFSVLEDLKSITVFGTDGNEEPSAVILQTTDAVDQIIATLDPIEGINVTQGENMSFVALREPGSAPGAPEEEHVAAIRKNPITNDRTLVIADTTAKLIDELNLFARQSAAGPNAGPVWASARPGAYLFVHVSQEGLGHLNEEAAQILGQAEQVHLEAGEDAGQVYAAGLLQVKDAETINSVVAIANGVLAMGRLTLASEPEGQQIISLLNAVRITARGNTMNVTFRMDTSKLIEIMKSLEGIQEGIGIFHDDDQDGEIEVRVEKR